MDALRQKLEEERILKNERRERGKKQIEEFMENRKI